MASRRVKKDSNWIKASAHGDSVQSEMAAMYFSGISLPFSLNTVFFAKER